MKENSRRHPDWKENTGEDPSPGDPLPVEREAWPEGLPLPSPGAGGDHKVSQLCAQAEEALLLALSGSTDPVLQELELREVRPLRKGSCLELVLRAGRPDADLGWLTAKLKRAKGYLRSEVAQAIYRKRTPDLTFLVLPMEEDSR